MCLSALPGTCPVQITMMFPIWQGTGGGLTLAKGTFEIPALTRHPKGEGKGSMVGMVWELWHRSMDVIVEKCHCEDFAWTCNVRRQK